MNSSSRWGSFPRWAGDSLRHFTAGKDAGVHMSALRIYLALALVAEFETHEASISWSTLQEQTGLSRPMVLRGIETAEKKGLISIDKSGHRHAYRLLRESGDETSFTQVPLHELRKALPGMPTRGFHALDALKAYITLLTVRRRNSDRAAIGHQKIWYRTGIQHGRIRSAVDVLINCHLVHVESSTAVGVGGHPFNEYVLIGFNNQAPMQPTSTAATTPAAAKPGAGVLVQPNPSILMPSLPLAKGESPF